MRDDRLQSSRDVVAMRVPDVPLPSNNQWTGFLYYGQVRKWLDAAASIVSHIPAPSGPLNATALLKEIQRFLSEGKRWEEFAAKRGWSLSRESYFQTLKENM